MLSEIGILDDDLNGKEQKNLLWFLDLGKKPLVNEPHHQKADQKRDQQENDPNQPKNQTSQVVSGNELILQEANDLKAVRDQNELSQLD